MTSTIWTPWGIVDEKRVRELDLTRAEMDLRWCCPEGHTHLRESAGIFYCFGCRLYYRAWDVGR
jgi:hypothetical protein